MKKYLLALTAVVAAIVMCMCVTACNNGGNGDDADTADFIGTYVLTAYKVDGADDPTALQSNATLIFAEGGTGVEKVGDIEVEFTWTKSGNTIEVTWMRGEATVKECLTVNGDKLTVENVVVSPNLMGAHTVFNEYTKVTD